MERERDRGGWGERERKKKRGRDMFNTKMSKITLLICLQDPTLHYIMRICCIIDAIAACALRRCCFVSTFNYIICYQLAYVM